jgi:NitT/TauT family transport system substrate-binding protein
MCDHHTDGWRRREFLGGLALAGAAGILGLSSSIVTAEPPPETTRIKLLYRRGNVCQGLVFLAQEALQQEGFTEVQYVVKSTVAEYNQALASGEADLSTQFAATGIIYMEEGAPLVFLAGLHVGCIELFGTDKVRAIRDLKGKTVAVPALRGSHHILVASMLAYVGIDPRRDVTWVTHPLAESARLLAEGKVDALLALAPEAQELRAKGIGHVVVNAMMDRPWSQYFCCVPTGHREFVRQQPVATKRALRAILRTADVIDHEPERVARTLVDRGYTTNYDYALQALKEIRYAEWREYDAEDTVRFYALRLHEAGMIKSSPQKILAQGTDWRFFNELKKELKE